MGNLRQSYTDEEWDTLLLSIEKGKKKKPLSFNEIEKEIFCSKDEVVEETDLLLLHKLGYPVRSLNLRQQVIRWFSENKDLHGFIEKFDDNTYDYVILSDRWDEKGSFGDGPFKYYLEAEDKCISRMIQILIEENT